uniref:Uncharacterized protein n=1 Tax=Anguilla anguilla TaxID=7936 RepID=A0A0E9QTF7_ANGAN
MEARVLVNILALRALRTLLTSYPTVLQRFFLQLRQTPRSNMSLLPQLYAWLASARSAVNQ